MENNKVLYRHLKPDGEVFYIGIGTISRAYTKWNRNKHWNNIANKYGYEVQLLKTNISWEDACELEIILIDYYGRMDLGLGKLCNKTNGGDGVSKLSKETLHKRSHKMRGSLNHMYHKRGIDNPFYGKKHTEEFCNNRRGEKNPMYGVKGSNNKLSKIVLDTQSGIYYESIKEASTAIDISYKHLSRMLSGVRKNKTSLCLV